VGNECHNFKLKIGPCEEKAFGFDHEIVAANWNLPKQEEQ